MLVSKVRLVCRPPKQAGAIECCFVVLAGSRSNPFRSESCDTCFSFGKGRTRLPILPTVTKLDPRFNFSCSV